MKKPAIETLELSQKQADFIQWYTSPASPTYDNISASAMKAGYSRKYAHGQAYRTLKPLAKKFLEKRIEKVEHTVDRAQFYDDLLKDAEKGIAERVRMKVDGNEKMVAIQQKDQHFVAGTIGRDRWSTKTIVENHGLFKLDGDSLSKLQNTFQHAIEATKDAPIVAQYTVKADEQDPKRAETG